MLNKVIYPEEYFTLPEEEQNYFADILGVFNGNFYDHFSDVFDKAKYHFADDSLLKKIRLDFVNLPMARNGLMSFSTQNSRWSNT